MNHPAQLLRTLEQRAKKRFGQHFLTSAGIVRQIIQVADVTDGLQVLEIGPGLRLRLPVSQIFDQVVFGGCAQWSAADRCQHFWCGIVMSYGNHGLHHTQLSRV